MASTSSFNRIIEEIQKFDAPRTCSSTAEPASSELTKLPEWFHAAAQSTSLPHSSDPADLMTVLPRKSSTDEMVMMHVVRSPQNASPSNLEMAIECAEYALPLQMPRIQILKLY